MDLDLILKAIYYLIYKGVKEIYKKCVINEGRSEKKDKNKNVHFSGPGPANCKKRDLLHIWCGER